MYLRKLKGVNAQLYKRQIFCLNWIISYSIGKAIS